MCGPARPAQPARPAGRGSRRGRRNTGASGTIPDVIVTGGATGIAYRRDEPEIILRTLANQINVAPAAAAWTFGAWAQVVTAALFTADAYVVGAIWAAIANLTATINGNGSQSTPVMRRFVLELGSGLVAAPPTPFARMHTHISLRPNVNVAGVVADPVVTTIADQALACEQLHCAPVFFAAGTPIAARAAKSDATTISNQAGCYIVTIPALPTILTVPIADLVADEVWPALAEASPVSGAAAWAFGAYVDVLPGPAAAHDYLVTSVTMAPAGGGTADTQIDMAIGAPGAEVIQARAASTKFPIEAPTRNEFYLPFRIMAGEQLRIRAAAGAGLTPVLCTVEMTQLI